MKTEKEIHQHRKDEHLSLAYKYWREEKNQTSGLTFSDSRIIPNSLPELSTKKINFSSEVFGQNFEFPFYIEAMDWCETQTRADKINAQLAEIAKNQHLAMAVGSQSIALKFPELAAGFSEVRKIHSSGFFLPISAQVIL